MGWSPGDAPKVEQAKIDLAFAKDGLYKLNKLQTTIANIQHAEKREAMLQEIARIHDAFINIEAHLNR
jgi:hypothetical protein